MADNNSSWREEQEINTVINQGLFDYMSGCEDLGLLTKHYCIMLIHSSKRYYKKVTESVQE